MYSDKELRNNKKLYIMRKFFTKAVSMIALLGAITFTVPQVSYANVNNVTDNTTNNNELKPGTVVFIDTKLENGECYRLTYYINSKMQAVLVDVEYTGHYV